MFWFNRPVICGAFVGIGVSEQLMKPPASDARTCAFRRPPIFQLEAPHITRRVIVRERGIEDQGGTIKLHLISSLHPPLIHNLYPLLILSASLTHCTQRATSDAIGLCRVERYSSAGGSEGKMKKFLLGPGWVRSSAPLRVPII